MPEHEGCDCSRCFAGRCHFCETPVPSHAGRPGRLVHCWSSPCADRAQRERFSFNSKKYRVKKGDDPMWCWRESGRKVCARRRFLLGGVATLVLAASRRVPTEVELGGEEAWERRLARARSALCRLAPDVAVREARPLVEHLWGNRDTAARRAGLYAREVMRDAGLRGGFSLETLRYILEHANAVDAGWREESDPLNQLRGIAARVNALQSYGKYDAARPWANAGLYIANQLVQRYPRDPVVAAVAHEAVVQKLRSLIAHPTDPQPGLAGGLIRRLHDLADRSKTQMALVRTGLQASAWHIARSREARTSTERAQLIDAAETALQAAREVGQPANALRGLTASAGEVELALAKNPPRPAAEEIINDCFVPSLLGRFVGAHQVENLMARWADNHGVVVRWPRDERPAMWAVTTLVALYEVPLA